MSEPKRRPSFTTLFKTGLLLALLAFSPTAQAFMTAYPGSVEYWATENNYTWIQTTDPITVGGYVEDLWSDYRLNQPEGRGRIGLVTATSWNAAYSTMAATVDFGRNYSVGIVFPELSAIQLISVPEPNLALLVPGVLLGRAAWNRLRRRNAGF